MSIINRSIYGGLLLAVVGIFVGIDKRKEVERKPPSEAVV